MTDTRRPLGDRVGCLTCGMAFPREDMKHGCPGCEALREAGAL